MAASSTPQGYQCEFIDSVPEDFYCKQCSLVARSLTITSCCGESYCNVCIHSTQQDNKPCPGCGQENFETFQQVKYQRKISSLRVACSVKERGCGWCGPLEHLDAHLDPDTGDCEYTDIHCPMKCQHEVNKKILEHHLAKECVKRDYMCPYCAFKATFEIVAAIHWPECSYYPLACPNRCGVTCERPTMEDHIKICRLQEVECEFQHIGCLEKFSREDYEEHMREKAQTHLTMMAATSVKMQQEFQGKLKEQEKRFEEKQSVQEQEFQAKLKEQESKFEEKLSALKRQFEETLVMQEQRFEGKLRETESKVQETMKVQEKGSLLLENLQEQEIEFMKSVKARSESSVAELEKFEIACQENRRITMRNFAEEKTKDHTWKSPAMYTHLYGYKLCVGIDANGWGSTRGESVNVDLWVMKGEHDDQLQWPVAAKFTLELINHFENGENRRVVQVMTWRRPDKDYQYVESFKKTNHFIMHSELPYNRAARTCFLKDDTLEFSMVDITILH